MLAEIPEPWRGFLADVDRVLAVHLGDQPPLELHCLGGFVVAMCYDVQRATGDATKPASRFGCFTARGRASCSGPTGIRQPGPRA